MRKIFNLKNVTKWIIVLAITLKLFIECKEMAFISRGYEAVGGEYLILLLPLFIFISIDTFKKYKTTK